MDRALIAVTIFAIELQRMNGRRMGNKLVLC